MFEREIFWVCIINSRAKRVQTLVVCQKIQPSKISYFPMHLFTNRWICSGVPCYRLKSNSWSWMMSFIDVIGNILLSSVPFKKMVSDYIFVVGCFRSFTGLFMTQSALLLLNLFINLQMSRSYDLKSYVLAQKLFYRG